MSMERLNKAARAAGYAMATPEEEIAEAASPAEVAATAPVESRALVVAAPKPDPAATPSGVAEWLKAYIPGFGSRATA